MRADPRQVVGDQLSTARFDGYGKVCDGRGQSRGGIDIGRRVLSGAAGTREFKQSPDELLHALGTAGNVSDEFVSVSVQPSQVALFEQLRVCGDSAQRFL